LARHWHEQYYILGNVRCRAIVVLGLLVPACLELGGVDEPSSEKDAGSGGSVQGDASFPDSPGSGGVSGVSGGGGRAGASAAPSWNLHTYTAATGAWTSIPLSSVWAGAHAPPTSGIKAATQLEHFDRLLIFGDDGNFYLRADGVWQPPVPIAEKFPALAAVEIGSVQHVSSPPDQPAKEEGLTFIVNPVAYIYEYHSNDALVFVEQVPLPEDPPKGPPVKTETAIFDFELRDPTKYALAADYYEFFTYYSDGYLYRFDAAFVWEAWPILSSPFWSGKPDAPDPGSIRAGWYEEKYERIQLVGP
jgi:hypothetical protein